MSSAWVVHKFGRTSLADAERYRRVASILRSEPGAQKAVVVSAMYKVTDALIELTDHAKNRDDTSLAQLEALQTRHAETATALLSAAEAAPFSKQLNSDCHDLREILRGVYLSRTYSEPTLELIAGHGELWSAQLLQSHLQGTASWLDARSVLVVDSAGACSVALQSYPRAHAFAGTSGSDNIVAFTTARYHTNSLIVQGSGAGPEVMAGGVFADLLRLASYLGGSAS